MQEYSMHAVKYIKNESRLKQSSNVTKNICIEHGLVRRHETRACAFKHTAATNTGCDAQQQLRYYLWNEFWRGWTRSYEHAGGWRAHQFWTQKLAESTCKLAHTRTTKITNQKQYVCFAEHSHAVQIPFVASPAPWLTLKPHNVFGVIV